MRRLRVHDTLSRPDPDGAPQEHTSCTSCHDPHTMASGAAKAPSIHPNFGRIDGINASGSPVASAAYEYEVCLKCHAEAAAVKPLVVRRIAQNNTRLEFAPGAVSFHPVMAQGRSGDVPSLRPEWIRGSMMYCSSCHASETGRALGGSGPSGTHGSNFPGLLAARYELGDNISESAGTYALCYACHDRTNILSNTSFPHHKSHIVDARTPCAVCHDAHGIASNQGSVSANSHLINFATAVVQPDRRTGRLEFRDLGRYRGECYLTCHGVDHSPLPYGQ
jgi:nitrate reductase cytochrome c-type subunit